MSFSPSPGFIVLLFSCIVILPDFSSAQANSCKGRCGEVFQRGRKCDCDAGCSEFNQCCPDYQSHCLKETPKTTVAKPIIMHTTTGANIPEVQATKKSAVYLSPLIQKLVPTTQSSATTASSKFQAIETTATDSNSVNEEMIQDLSESQLITLSTLPPPNPSTSRPVFTTMQRENLSYPEFQRDDETVLLELTEAMPYQEEFLITFMPYQEEFLQSHSFSTEPSASSSVFSTIQSTTEASTKPEEHVDQLVLESETTNPVVTGQTNTPAAPVNDQEPETTSESGFEPSMTDAPATDTPSPPEGDVPSASPTQTPASTSTLSLTTTAPTNTQSDIFLPEFMTTVSNLEDSTSLPQYSTESSTPLIAFSTPQTTTVASEKPEQQAKPTAPQASEISTTRPDISVLASISATDNVEEFSPTELQTPGGAPATPPGAENIPDPAVPTDTESVTPTNGAPSSASPTTFLAIMSTPSSTTTVPTSDVLLADDNDDANLCSGRPVNGITTLLNGTMYVFRGHWFWMLSSYGIVAGYPRRITDVWGIPSPIDSVFTRCNCQGKTFFFKGTEYWRFENGGMDPGYPKLISSGFGGIKGKITAALSISSTRIRPESVYFFKQGGLVQKYSYTQNPPQTCKKMQTQYSIYSIRNRFARQLSSQSKNTVTLGQEINIKLQWRGFPTSVTSAVSVPNAKKRDGYDYFVFSRTQYYNINILADQPTVIYPSPSLQRQQSTAKDWFKCP
ncbi:proteoglycan 4-like isoform X2 [Polyodon spathula]|uniref:proteoglycan 4-like isoform X2 n=1 Tax=Polyodon spathula TaxID=7913 RepID=UPI001B7E2B82|nr:proteoglycan 4-like isoform X2 [Polyodon spathula]